MQVMIPQYVLDLMLYIALSIYAMGAGYIYVLYRRVLAKHQYLPRDERIQIWVILLLWPVVVPALLISFEFEKKKDVDTFDEDS